MNTSDQYSASSSATPAQPARLSAWLVRSAARHTPVTLAPRLEEEWLADLAVQSGMLARVRFALGCWWATQVIAHNPAAYGVTAAGIAGGHGAIAALSPGEASPPSQRSTIIFAVLCLHVAAISAFMYGIKNPPRLPDPKPIDAWEIKLPVEPLAPPPGPVVDTSKWKPVDPNIDLNMHLPTVITESQPIVEPTKVIPTTVVAKVVRVTGGPGAGFPRTMDFYPAASIRLGESGVAAVRVCVDSRGRLTGDPAIAETSGSERLDAGALALSRAGSGHYRSTTEDGKPVNSCYAYRVRFQLDN